MTLREQELSIALRRLVDSLSREAFFPDSEKGQAMESAIELLAKVDQARPNKKADKRKPPIERPRVEECYADSKHARVQGTNFCACTHVMYG